jgi:hypothetical protein
MTLQGTVHNGVVVLTGGAVLPEGTIVQVAPQTPICNPDGLLEKPMTLTELAAWVESQPCDLPEDLAENHDHYLHGMPKKQ